MTKGLKELRGLQALSGKGKHVSTRASFHLPAIQKDFINSLTEVTFSKVSGFESGARPSALKNGAQTLPTRAFVFPVGRNFIGSKVNSNWQRCPSVRSQASRACQQRATCSHTHWH